MEASKIMCLSPVKLLVIFVVEVRGVEKNSENRHGEGTTGSLKKGFMIQCGWLMFVTKDATLDIVAHKVGAV